MTSRDAPSRYERWTVCYACKQASEYPTSLCPHCGSFEVQCKALRVRWTQIPDFLPALFGKPLVGVLEDNKGVEYGTIKRYFFR